MITRQPPHCHTTPPPLITPPIQSDNHLFKTQGWLPHCTQDSVQGGWSRKGGVEDFPGGPVAKTLCSQSRDPGSTPGLATTEIEDPVCFN